MWKVLLLLLLCSFSLWLLTIGNFLFTCTNHFFILLGWKKHALASLQRKSDGYKTVDTSWCWDLFHLFLSSSEVFFFFSFFENRFIFSVSINYPKPSSKEVFNQQLWSCTFVQHVTVLFHLYTSFKFLESFAYCIPLSASLRTEFSQNENIVSLSISIVWKDYSVFIFSKVVLCSWRCERHRPKTAIIKWTCPLILTSSKY